MIEFDENKHPRDELGRFAKMSASELKAKQAIDISTLAKTIALPDEILPHSVGAKWANYDIQMSDGTVAHFQEGSKLHHKEVFAGKGCKRKIDQVDMLVERYGGKAEEWQKIKAIGTIVKENGEIEEAEIHWYEEPTVGRKRLKVK